MAAQECRDPGDPDAAVRDVGGLHGDDLLTGDSTASVREQSGGVDSAEKGGWRITFGCAAAPALPGNGVIELFSPEGSQDESGPLLAFLAETCTLHSKTVV